MDKQNPQGDQIASSPLFKKFLGKAEDYLQKPTRMKQLLNDAYTKASEKKDLGSLAHEAWDTLQTMFRLIRSSVAGEYTGLPNSTVIAAIAVTIYFLSPIDLIPDFIPVLGLLDDVALVAWFSTTIKEELDKFAEWEKTRPTVVETTGEPTEATSAATPPVEQPSASQPTPSKHEDAETSATVYSDTAANTTDSSREPNTSTDSRPSGGDAGGNVR